MTDQLLDNIIVITPTNDMVNKPIIRGVLITIFWPEETGRTNSLLYIIRSNPKTEPATSPVNKRLRTEDCIIENCAMPHSITIIPNPVIKIINDKLL